MESKQTPVQGAIVVSATTALSQRKSDNQPLSVSGSRSHSTDGGVQHKPVGFFQLFRYADANDYLLLFVGLIGAALSGACWPGFSIAFGELLNAFFKPDPESEVNKWVLIMLYIAIGSFVFGFLEVSCTKLSGSRQATRVKHTYLNNLLRQDMMFFDVQSTQGQLMKGLNQDVPAFQDAISERLGAFVHNLAVFVVGLAIAFWRGWALTLVILSAIPALVIVSALIAIFTSKLSRRSAGAYIKAGSIAYEALVNHRTVTAFCAEDSVVKKYDDCLEKPVRWGKIQGFLTGLTLGATHFVFFGAYALALWYGSTLVAADSYTGGEVINVLLSAVLAGFALGQAMPHLEFFQRGQQAAADLYALIARIPAVDVNKDGVILPSCRGDVEFSSVNFAYPAAPTRQVVTDFDLVVPAGTSIALVGESGCGKSTVIQLLQRFYDPLSGSVLLDGTDIRKLQLRWFRSRLGFVGQEPVLFDASIYNNIAYGKAGASKEEVIQAAMLANAHSWIIKLPDGYETRVGMSGGNLSGGQKQRIAIARAILRNPKILLLDEATSSLDVNSERAVKEALDKLMVGRTTFIVAHRLTTVVSADSIAVVKNGRVIEQGSSEELLKHTGGLFATMWAMQQTKPWETAEDGAAAAGEENNRTARVKPGAVPESVLKRGSVRLSIIPAAIQEKLARKKNANGLTSAASGSQQTIATKQPSYFRKLLAMNRPEWSYGFFGVTCSAILGLAMPIYALALGSILADYYDTDPEAVKAAGRKWGAVFTGIGAACLLFEPIQGWCFGVMGHKLARRVRVATLKAMLHQDGGWFDAKENASGVLVSRLSTDAAAVRGAVGDRIGLLVQNLSCAIAAYVIAFVSSWSVTLVVTAALPVLGLAQVIQAKVYFGAGQDDAAAASDAGSQVASEALGAVRTVTAFGLQEEVSSLYVKSAQPKKAQKTAVTAGLGFGFSQFVLYGIFCLAFWYGGTQIRAGNISFMDLLRAFLSVFYCAFGIAQAQAAFPDIAAASTATKRIFSIIDNKPDVDYKAGACLPTISGAIKFENCTFAYPARPGRLVLKHFNLTVAAGKSLAIVGESGMGKSTVISLLERIYDPIEGAVLLDGVDIRKLNIKWLRTQIGLVNQEPVLFTASVIDNIRYGKENATLEEVMAAAKVANALDFIEKLPEKYDTKVGEGGISLSGGQKQRIAIARAVLKDPKILLLDEATSALDGESERLVQLALDKIMMNRTTLIVAHRLSTIRTADKIAVVYRGRVLEEGKHEELVGSKGYYAHMIATAAAAAR